MPSHANLHRGGGANVLGGGHMYSVHSVYTCSTNLVNYGTDRTLLLVRYLDQFVLLCFDNFVPHI